MNNQLRYCDEENFISAAETELLLEHFLQAPEKWHKPTGPITLSLTEQNHPFVDVLLERISSHLKTSARLVTGNFFSTTAPYIIHCDGKVGHPILPSYHVALLPLCILPKEGTDLSHLVLFNNFYYDEPSKFFLGEPSVEEFKRASYPLKNSPKGISNILLKQELPPSEDLNHLQSSWLQGLTVHKKIPWTPGKLIVFPSAQLHCSSNFKNASIHTKIGLSMVLDVELHKDNSLGFYSASDSINKKATSLS